MAAITRETSELLVEIDERGNAALFVAGVRVVTTAIDIQFEGREGGNVFVSIPARFVTVKSVKSVRRPEPSGGII